MEGRGRLNRLCNAYPPNTNLSDAASDIPDEARYLLGFNEPNFYSQADLSASESASLWPGVEAIADGQPTELGQTYVSLPHDPACGK